MRLSISWVNLRAWCLCNSSTALSAWLRPIDCSSTSGLTASAFISLRIFLSQTRASYSSSRTPQLTLSASVSCLCRSTRSIQYVTLLCDHRRLLAIWPTLLIITWPLEGCSVPKRARSKNASFSRIFFILSFNNYNPFINFLDHFKHDFIREVVRESPNKTRFLWL